MGFLYNDKVVGRLQDANRLNEDTRRWEVTNGRAQTTFDNQQTEFAQRQSDRSAQDAAAEKLRDSIRGSEYEDANTWLGLMSRPDPQQYQATNALPVNPITSPQAQGPANPVTNNLVAPVGSFAGDPASIMRSIQGIPDPQERARAAEAFRTQINNPAANTAGLVASRQSLGLSADASGPAQQVSPLPQALVRSGNTGIPEVQAPAMGAQEPAARPMPSEGQAPRRSEPKPDPRRAQLEAMLESAIASRDTKSQFELASAIKSLDNAATMGSIVRAVQDLPPERFGAMVERMTNGVIDVAGTVGANGLTNLTIGKTKASVTRAEMGVLAAGLWSMENGNIDVGYKAISSVNKDLADAAEKFATGKIKALGENNRIVESTEKMRVDGLRLQSDASLKEAQAGYYGQRVHPRNLVQMQDDKGNLVMVDSAQLPTDANGVLQLPPNVRPAKTKTDPQVKLDAMSKLLSSGAVPNMASARMVVDQMYGDAPDAQSVAAAVAANLEAMRQRKLAGAPGAPQTQQATPRAQGITTLSAPRSGDEARGIRPPVMSDDDLFLKSMGVAR